MADVTAPPPLLRRLAAEAFGTYLLVFSVLGAALFFAPDYGALPVALSIGIGVLTAAYAVGSISGGHFNPAVTLGAAVAGRVGWGVVLPYWVAQLFGGTLASLTLGLVGLLNGKSLDFAAVSNGYGEHSPSDFGLWAVFVAEIVATLFFVLIILGVTSAGSSTSGFAPLAIGLALTMFHLVMIPISNASLNPARSFAPGVLAGPDTLAQLWVFLVAPLIGGLLAGALHRPLFGDRR
ncbi:aquaporin [Protaetiibacter larvae]|uniref:Aquaporin Z n=1 Tax=Protaetiibacter larvae TaxID=2592654 RepID=A0A5C1Y4B0_9MICO|nr:aquaporin [Protaetiibacter larvae]QEO08591.1 aquaporin Z [Protaetiibacter larvae]